MQRKIYRILFLCKSSESLLQKRLYTEIGKLNKQLIIIDSLEVSGKSIEQESIAFLKTRGHVVVLPKGYKPSKEFIQSIKLNAKPTDSLNVLCRYGNKIHGHTYEHIRGKLALSEYAVSRQVNPILLFMAHRIAQVFPYVTSIGPSLDQLAAMLRD